MKENSLSNENIKNLIYTIRGKQVMLDSDVAMLYNYETKKINQTINRNKERFPEEFCFKLTERELEIVWSQIVTTSKNIKYKGRKYLPYVFTEQGIAMLSGLLKSNLSIKVSINIINAFAEMKKFLMINGQVLKRLTNIEYQIQENNKKINNMSNKLQQEQNMNQRIFFNGQIYDSYLLIIDIIKKANNKILIIDNYINDSILKMLTKKKNNVEAVILTSNKSNIEKLDIKKFNEEYPILKISKTNKFHDRFIVIDDKEMYHLGASIKDLGKKCSGINKIENTEIIEKIISL